MLYFWNPLYFIGIRIPKIDKIGILFLEGKTQYISYYQKNLLEYNNLLECIDKELYIV